jgi:hypothetical protein
MADIEIKPDDLERSAGTLSQLGNQLAAGGQKLQSAGQNLLAAASQDESGFGAAITRAFGRGVEITGKVFGEGGGWLSRAGDTMRGNAANHRGNDEEQARRFRAIQGEEEDPPASARPVGGNGSGNGDDSGGASLGDPSAHKLAQQRLREQLGEPEPDSDYTAGDLPRPHDVHQGLLPGSPKYDELTGGRQPLSGTDLAEFDQTWSNGRNPNTGYTEYRYPTEENGHPNGFASPSDRQPEWVAQGTRLDRFGGPGGAFLSPAGAPWPTRALPPHTLTSPYHVYEVARPFPAYVGPAAPWFDQPGNGTQYYLGDRHNVDDLLNHGYLREVTGDYA